MPGALPVGMLDSTTAKDLIKPHMPVVCSENGQFATVDHIEGTWVTSVDDKVHVDRPGDQAMKEWTTSPNGDSESAKA
jgi:hypothetical protein